MPETAKDGHAHRGEYQSGTIAGTALVSAATFNNRPLRYADVGGLAIFEGDIVLGRVADLRRVEIGGLVLESIGITGQQFRWPNATVPFGIDPAMPDQQRVIDAIAHWEANTPLRFVRRAGGVADFVMFQSGSGCSSQVGRRGGQQTVTLGQGCGTGNAIHEIGHTIGLWHEQSREDRDTFVRIVWANIDPSLQHNFTQHVSDGDDLGAYDYGSIMHYPADAFSTNRQATIVALQPIPSGVTMGQRDGLSPGDIAGVLALYPRQFATLKEPVQDVGIKHPIRDTFKEVRKEPIFDTVKEVRKDPIQDTIKELRKDPIQDTIKEVRGDPTLAETVFPHGPGPGPLQPGVFNQGRQVPFIMAGGSQFGGGGAMDPSAAAMSDVQALAEAIVQLEQQHAELMAAYDAAVQAAGGGGT